TGPHLHFELRVGDTPMDPGSPGASLLSSRALNAYRQRAEITVAGKLPSPRRAAAEGPGDRQRVARRPGLRVGRTGLRRQRARGAPQGPGAAGPFRLVPSRPHPRRRRDPPRGGARGALAGAAPALTM